MVSTIPSLIGIILAVTAAIENYQALGLSSEQLHWILVVLFSLSTLGHLLSRSYSKRLRDQFFHQQSETLKLNDKLQEQHKLTKDHESEGKALREQIKELSAKQEILEAELIKTRQLASKAEADKRHLESSIQNAKPEALQAEVVSLLSHLQKQGRFLDFVMGDISKYPDEKVGAAARIVHQGCLKVIEEYFDMAPVFTTDEGNVISITEQDNPRGYKILGKGAGSLPIKGRLIHKGWKTSRVDLPSKTSISDADRTIIAPAELEITN